MEIEYITRAGCPSCEAYRRAVIEPLSEEYPGRVRVMERLNNAERITRVPMVVVTDGGREVMRLLEMPTLERLEDILESA